MYASSCGVPGGNIGSICVDGFRLDCLALLLKVLYKMKDCSSIH